MPNVKPIDMNGEELLSLAQFVASMSDEQVRALGVIMFNESKTRKNKMRFMQKVFVRYRGAANRDYVSNFMEAYVMYANGTHYKLMSADGRCTLTYGEHCRPVIFTDEEFAPMLAKMKQRGKLVDPDTEQLISRRFRCEEEYDLNIKADDLIGEVTTIDEVFKENGIRKGRKKGLPDLISLVEDAATDFEGNVDKKARVYSRDVKRDKGEESTEERQAKRSGSVKTYSVRG